MPKRIDPLTRDQLREIDAKAEPGFHAVSPNLYLKIAGAGRSWVFRYQGVGNDHKRHDLGLGPYPLVDVADAREKVAELRKDLRRGIDPLAERAAQRQQQAIERAASITVSDACDAYFKANRKGWSNVHADQFSSSIRTYVVPIIGKLPIASIELPMVLKVLEPIWLNKTETASRVRRRLEAVLDWAKVRGYRAGDNPARWAGHLEKVLASPEKAAPVKHYVAMRFDQLPAFMARLRATNCTPARALELAILTATRTAEVRFATWREIDEKSRLWVIPANRMKRAIEHRVPLCDRAIAIIEEMKAKRISDAVFPGQFAGFIAKNAQIKALHRIDPTVTVHGMRSAFSDWANESEVATNETIEWCLAHLTGPKSERAYRRGDALNRRRQLLNAWAAFLDHRKTGEVVPLRSRA